MFSTINKYLYKNYLIGFSIILIIFSLLIFTGDLIENFRKAATKDIPIDIIFKITLYNYPSLIFELFPIIIFFSCIFSIIVLIKSSEYTVLKASGIPDYGLLTSPVILFFILTILFVTAINPLTTLFHSKYDNLNYQLNKGVP